ncbi:MAG: hypothetical protein ACRDQZ_21020, partial [Mycobacteriales bacterium]
TLITSFPEPISTSRLHGHRNPQPFPPAILLTRKQPGYPLRQLVTRLQPRSQRRFSSTDNGNPNNHLPARRSLLG